MKENHSPKKISNYDKFQAVRRKPSYQADYRDFLLWCRKNQIDETKYLDHPEAAKKAGELFKKYGITYLFNPSIDIPEHWGSHILIEKKEIVEVLYPNKYRRLNDNDIKQGVKPRFLTMPLFSNGDNLLMKIDLKADKEDIINQLIEHIDYYQSFIPRNDSRMTSDRKVDKWEVWDIYNQTKSFKKTVQMLNERASAYAKFFNDSEDNAKGLQKLDVSTVRKAYYRAFELVYGEKYDPEKHEPEKLPVKLRGTCDKCPERPTCKALCPEVLEYVEQDRKYQRETPKPEHELDILSSLGSTWKTPKSPME